MGLRKFQAVDEFNCLRHGHITEFHDILASYSHRQKLRFQLIPLTCRTCGDPHVFFHFFFDPFRLCLPVPAFQIVDNALKGVIPVLSIPVAVRIDIGQFLIPCAVQQNFLELLRQILVRRIHIRTIFLRQRADHLPVEAGVFHGRKDVAQALLIDALVLIRDDKIRIDALNKAQSITVRARAQGVVE